jgi:AraC family transcriptional regulator
MAAVAAPLLARRVLYEGAALRIGHMVARPTSEDCIEVEAPRENVLALPLAGLFARHGAARRPAIATASHGVFFPAGRPYRMSFPGCVGDAVLTLQWSDAALAATLPGAAIPESQVLLDPAQLMGRGLLWQRFARGEADAVEVEELCVGLLASALNAARGGARTRGARPGGRDRIDRVREAVAVAPERKWSLAELASIARLSPYHLAHLFRDEIGIPVHAYVVRARLSKALSAVLDSDAGITDIALEAGFASHSHFTARFRALFGVTPGQLRRGQGLSPRQLRKIVTAR